MTPWLKQEVRGSVGGPPAGGVGGPSAGGVGGLPAEGGFSYHSLGLWLQLLRHAGHRSPLSRG